MKEYAEIKEILVSFEDKLDTHIKEEEEFKQNIEPFLQGIKGFKVLRNSALWFAGTITAIGSAILIWKQLIK